MALPFFASKDLIFIQVPISKQVTKDGFPKRADTYPAATPVPCLAVYTPKANSESPAAAAVILSQSENLHN